MNRRNFIKQAGGTAMSLPVFINGIQLSTIAKAPLFQFMEESDRVLVLVQMNGGNDGLNMVIPRDQYAGLSAVRRNIMIPENSVLPVTDLVGFHPSLKALKYMYDEGRVGVLQSVGYPNQNRSHFRSYDIWASGSSAEEFVNTGWMGRYFDTLYGGYPEGYPNSEFPHPFAITMDYVVSETCQGTASNFSVTVNDPFSMRSLFEGEVDEIPNTPYGDELKYLRTSIAQTNKYSETITEAANLGRNAVTYSNNNRLARQLKNVALLISGGLRTKIYIVSIGGFDTHAGQVDKNNPLIGSHADLLEKVSNAISTFQNDLKAQGLEHRVVGMTFSEFGRKIKSNESYGTDHGTASPLILFGSCINAKIFGNNPEIPTNIDSSEGLPMENDFRDVYGSILVDWFKVEETKVKSLLYEDFQKLPIIEECTVTTSSNNIELSESIEIKVSPNPFREKTGIEFNLEKDAWVRLSIFNAVGGEVKVLTNQRLSAGEHRIPIEGISLEAGVYFCHLKIGHYAKTKRMVKV
ncbi:MAG: DUF1501 domain-containing protein [Saprospiraceae bacterium]|nr:DUF1501 domain-containing protein [Saprospiraceae bacterium]